MFFTLKDTLSQSTPQILFLLPKGLYSATYVRDINFHNFLKATFKFEEYFFLVSLHSPDIICVILHL